MSLVDNFISENDQDYQLAIEVLMEKEIPMLEVPEGLEYNEELIHLEKPNPYVPYNEHKQKQYVPTGPAFHEKKAKNLKKNVRRSKRKKK